ncbi:ATP-dependent DNA helicase PIF1 [Purpureocillium lavendulum]|uniref:ATP-dependent DNA helicase n=1 Tax=Purpureocillium lavendulum TaxID=1247861 RepID=A0AB34FB66_9HYPO|nr:ATP-dependent DNA helicase PIF1 [Purpureocillium lavendulum]
MPGQLHRRLGCEHMFPDELKGLSPIEEKLIAPNSCYGLFTRHAVSTGARHDAKYPKHIKGHVTVFPNNVQELVTDVLPHPLLKVMDEVCVSWQGPEKPTPRDLSGLLSVRRRVVEMALVWLRRHNPHYANIRIDTAEMDSWGEPAGGVPAAVYGRMERHEPSPWEKTRTAHVVPPAERGLDDEGAVAIDEILASLTGEQDLGEGDVDSAGADRNTEAAGGGRADGVAGVIDEVTSSGMFALDGAPNVADAEKLRFACRAVGGAGPSAWIQTSGEGSSATEGRGEAFIRVSRGDDFADSSEAAFFAKTFPTLLPFGLGGPKLAEEDVVDGAAPAYSAMVTHLRAAEGEGGVGALVASRNLHLRAWADIVLRRHGGRFATHHIFAFLVFNMGLRSRNRQASILSVTRKNFRKVERIVQSMTAERLAAASVELEKTGKTNDDGVKELLRSLSLYGHRQPMSREGRLTMRRKIQSNIVVGGVPAIWFTLNPNDITNPVKLRLAAYRILDPRAAEALLESLENAYKRTRLAISDPASSAIFFHREMALFFEKYVNVGGESVFGRISHYFGAVETNERGALHVHGLLWLQGNARLASAFDDVSGQGGDEYKERIVRYVDSVFSEGLQELDAEAFCAVQAERSVVADISDKLAHAEQFSSSFEEEANFCAGATQIHTHSATCVKYSLGKSKQKGALCRFKAPWKLVEKTSLTDEGILKIRRSHPLVNRWNKAMAVGLRHNHDISFIATQQKTMALIYYVTNYATKVEDPIWKRAVTAAELLPSMSCDEAANEKEGAGESAGMLERANENRTRQFLMKVANRVFTERSLSQVEVVAHLLGYPSEFSNSSAWAYLNTSGLYWHIFRRWPHLRRASGAVISDNATVDESIIVEEAGHRLSHVEAYHHRGRLLAGLCLYDYVSIVRLKRRDAEREGPSSAWPEVRFEESWPVSKHWIQVLRRPGKQATVCLDGYLSKEFTASEEDDACHRRAAVQHLALFVPWEAFLSEEEGDINDIWIKAQCSLSARISRLVGNVQLLRRSAEDAKRDAKQWAASCGDDDATAAQFDDEGDGDKATGGVYEATKVGDATRLMDVIRTALGTSQVTAGSAELTGMLQRLGRFQHSALGSSTELEAAAMRETGVRIINLPGEPFTGAPLPSQDQVRGIKSQQMSASREREMMIQGIQSGPSVAGADHSAALRAVMSGFGEDSIEVAATDAPERYDARGTGMEVQIGSSRSFLAAGREWAKQSTLNKRQSIALLIICRHLDRVGGSDRADAGQLCQFIGGEGGTGKSRVIEALVGLFAARGTSKRILITATSGTAAARISGITIHSACGFSIDTTGGANAAKDIDGVRLPKQAERFVHGQSRMDWQEKDVLVIDEVSMLGARTLHAVNEQLCRLRGSQRDFGGIPVVVFCGDFHQFRPVQERSILLPSTAISWDVDNSFKAEQRHQHDRAHGLWRHFTTVIMLDEQMRAAGDPELQRLLTRIRRGDQDQSDLELLNSTCYQEGRRIPWETGITVVTPLNRNRWNLNMEATLAFQTQQRSMMRIFISEHKWKNGVPTEEEAIMMLNQGDDSAIPVPAVFMFVPGMPVVVNSNTYQGLKVTNGGAYTAAEVIVDKAFPGYRISADTAVHFGPPAGLILASETTRDLHFVGMPPGTVLLGPMSVKIQRQRKRPWQQNDVSRKGLPCTAAFACTDYKVQGRSLDRVALELRGTRTTNVGGRVVPAQCDPYSLYVQLSRCRTLDGIMLVSKVRERDLVGNRVPEEMRSAQARLEELSDRTLREAVELLGDEW